MNKWIQWWRRYRLGGKMQYGEDLYLGRNVHITRPHLVTLDSHVSLDDGFYCTTQLLVGDYCHISAYVTVIGGKEAGLWLKGFNTVGPHTVMLCASDRFSGSGLVGVTIPQEYWDIRDSGTIIVEEFANIGAGTVVMPKTVIGEGAVVGANSFVNKDLEPWTVYVGSPVRAIKSRPSGIMKDAARKLRKELG